MDFKKDWSKYAFDEGGPRIASDKELKARFKTVDFSDETIAYSGPVLLSDGMKAVVNNDDEHWLCVGETGSKKTRCFAKPLLYSLAKARESAVITDVKGELASDPTVRGMMEKNGVKGIYLDFRNFASDGYDLLEEALELRLKGNKNKAYSCIVRLVSSLVGDRDVRSKDPFWDIMAKQALISTLEYLLEAVYVNKRTLRKYFNLITLARFMELSELLSLCGLVNVIHEDSNDISLQGLRCLTTTAERTMISIAVSVFSFMTDYLIQEDMVTMLSTSTFDIRDIYAEPTFVFLIVPDETSAYDSISGILLDNMYSRLVDEYTEKYQNGRKPRCRVNWVCDEFCNIKINDMGAKISASRSREMRFFLVCQSMKQMLAAYPDSATTIIGNCKNLLFLKSSDPEMLEYVSSVSGITHISEYAEGERVIPVDELRTLKKEREYKEAVFIRDNFVYKAKLPDGDYMDAVKEFAGTPIRSIPAVEKEPIRTLTASSYVNLVRKGTIDLPFVPEHRSRVNLVLKYDDYLKGRKPLLSY